ncbi:putative metal-dependent hydrolase [Dokdonia sinensis]|uniref:Putative metal-dependent hydrolase n=1 Tax=Dokdonia sinensis TaxID=2479847 RepID=A0A3M0G0H9_9FLAO|nr:bacillithiol transferase BstA [Dokdonia sinensis]RMB57687.1 putative metal-dependent hydrolase [Dokdonia sinensis]
MSDITHLQYPIGKASIPTEISEEKLQEWITTLELLPVRLSTLVSDMSDEQLDTPYRDGGWTVRQLVHHISDSHHHSYIRFKWALTEDNPLIKPYLEKEWAELDDAKYAPIEWSLKHIEVVHFKLVRLLKGMTNAQFERTFRHPEGKSTISLRQNVGQYAWHSNHHYAHIENLVKRENAGS